MTRDAALLDEESLAFRVYGWNGPWVSLGLFQKAERDLLRPDLVPWTMRPTGGKAVLHGHDVTVGLAAPLDLLGVGSRDVKGAYRAIIRPLIAAMNACGLRCALAEETRFADKGSRTADCFAHVSPNDVVEPVHGMKVCGCALKLTERSVLVQASIPNGLPLVDPALLFAAPGPVSPLTWDETGFAESLMTALAGTREGVFPIMRT